MVYARKMIRKPQPTRMGNLATPVALDHRVDPTTDPTSELVIYAVSGPGEQPSSVASGSKPTTGAAYLSARAAIRKDALSAACGCCCQSAAVLLLRQRLLLLFHIGHILYWYDNYRASFYYSIYLLSMQSPAPSSSLAEPPSAASPQLGQWICQQGLRSARIWGLLLVLAAASAAAATAASTTTALAFFRLVTFRTGMTVFITTVTASAGTGFASHHMP